MLITLICSAHVMYLNVCVEMSQCTPQVCIILMFNKNNKQECNSGKHSQ